MRLLFCFLILSFFACVGMQELSEDAWPDKVALRSRIDEKAQKSGVTDAFCEAFSSQEELDAWTLEYLPQFLEEEKVRNSDRNVTLFLGLDGECIVRGSDDDNGTQCTILEYALICNSVIRALETLDIEE